MFENKETTKEEVVKNKKVYSIDRGTADNEFDRFCDLWEIVADTEGMNQDDLDSFNQQKEKMIHAIRKGRLVVNNDETLVYTLSKTHTSDDGPVTIRRPKGADLIAMDRHKDNQGIHRMYAMMASMTRKNEKYFSLMDGVDIKVFMAIVTLFLAS